MTETLKNEELPTPQGAFALFRLPGRSEAVLVEQERGEPKAVESLAALNGRSGYVVAPFRADRGLPILLVRPDRVRSFRLPEPTDDLPTDVGGDADPCGDRARYHADFALFHARLADGAFRKLVLSRSATVGRRPGQSALRLFVQACRRHPHLFVTLFSTKPSGTWLVATPEVLLEGSGRQWHTAALAGTMPADGQEQPCWSAKNRQEQRLVADYLAATLALFAQDIEEEGPRTVQAANVLHLRSDFRFSLPDDGHTGTLLQALHPTPAVGGLPKEEAVGFILRHESGARRYYSGFSGPLALGGETHLFVSLRCMEMERHAWRLYAGGGLLTDSDEQQEWTETEAKLATMRALLADGADTSSSAHEKSSSTHV